MKKKIKDFIIKVYANTWFNLSASVILFILGLTQSWPGFALLALYLVGAVATGKLLAFTGPKPVAVPVPVPETAVEIQPANVVKGKKSV